MWSNGYNPGMQLTPQLILSNSSNGLHSNSNQSNNSSNHNNNNNNNNSQNNSINNMYGNNNLFSSNSSDTYNVQRMIKGHNIIPNLLNNSSNCSLSPNSTGNNHNNREPTLMRPQTSRVFNGIGYISPKPSYTVFFKKKITKCVTKVHMSHNKTYFLQITAYNF